MVRDLLPGRGHNQSGVARKVFGSKGHMLDMVRVVCPEHVAPGIGGNAEAARGFVGGLDFSCVRTEAEIHAPDRNLSVRRFDRVARAVVAAIGGVHPVVKPPEKTVDIVLRVGDREPGKEHFFDVRLAVPVRVFEEDDVRRARHQDPVAPRQNRRRILQTIGKHRGLFVIPVQVRIFEQLYAPERLRDSLRLVGIVSHFDGVHSARGVEGNSDRIHNVRLARRELDSEVFVNPGGGNEALGIH